MAIAKSAATNALRHIAFVICFRTRNRRRTAMVRMQEDVTEMIAAGAHAKELGVQHKGN